MNNSPSASSGVLNLAASSGVLTSTSATWSDFVQDVLQVTVAAYQELRLVKVAQQGWEEDKFSWGLYKCIQKLLKGHKYLRVQYQHEVPTPEMTIGSQSPKEAPEIDISLYGDWESYDYDVIHFAWEAKRIAEKGHYGDLRGKYVANGIFRFINGKYSAAVNDAGMLGYIIDGKPANIANELNGIMLNAHADPDAPAGTPSCALTVTDNLQPAAPVGSFSDIYVSQHNRASGRPIKLYHLLLTFDFA